jgi:Uncharacterized conserved protein
MAEASETFHLLPATVLPSCSSVLYQPAQRAFYYRILLHTSNICMKIKGGRGVGESVLMEKKII